MLLIWRARDCCKIILLIKISLSCILEFIYTFNKIKGVKENNQANLNENNWKYLKIV